MLRIVVSSLLIFLCIAVVHADDAPGIDATGGATPKNSTPGSSTPDNRTPDSKTSDGKIPDTKPTQKNPYDVLNSTLREEKMIAKVNANDCTAQATVEYEKFVENLLLFREDWLSPDYSLDFYGHHSRQVLVMIVMNRLAAAMTYSIYNRDNRPTTDCHFSTSVSYNDKYGQSHTFKALTWNFTNTIASKVNWEKFDEKKIGETAEDFRYTKETDDWIEEEPPLSDDGKRHPMHYDDPAPCSTFLLSANAVFIRATTFCKRNYMDSKAGYMALDGAKACAKTINEKQWEREAKQAMMRLDTLVRAKGRRSACDGVVSLAQQVVQGRR